jgi:hypothetical protein
MKKKIKYIKIFMTEYIYKRYKIFFSTAHNEGSASACDFWRFGAKAQKRKSAILASIPRFSCGGGIFQQQDNNE